MRRDEQVEQVAGWTGWSSHGAHEHAGAEHYAHGTRRGRTCCIASSNYGVGASAGSAAPVRVAVCDGERVLYAIVGFSTRLVGRHDAERQR
jgi:hypothetical protein